MNIEQISKKVSKFVKNELGFDHGRIQLILPDDTLIEFDIDQKRINPYVRELERLFAMRGVDSPVKIHHDAGVLTIDPSA